MLNKIAILFNIMSRVQMPAADRRAGAWSRRCRRWSIEWDLAYLPDAALTAFPNRDVAALARLRAAVSYCVATWCWAQPGRAPEVAAAAQYHLDAVRHSWLAE